MGINNIHLLIEPDLEYRNQRAIEIHLRELAAAHKRGEHPYGFMRRDCPLCQKS